MTTVSFDEFYKSLRDADDIILISGPHREVYNNYSVPSANGCGLTIQGEGKIRVHIEPDDEICLEETGVGYNVHNVLIRPVTYTRRPK